MQRARRRLAILLRIPTRRLAASRTTHALLFVAALSGCASPLPPMSWVRLPVDPPGQVSPAIPSGAVSSESWLLRLPVAFPGHLGRDAVLVRHGSAGLQPLEGLRWAEPLRDAVPRLLRQDLERRLGASVWVAPLPPGAAFARQLTVEILALDILEGRRAVEIRARWTLADVRGATAPRVFEEALVTAVGDPGVDGLAAAHRLALWQLAGRIAASARP